MISTEQKKTIINVIMPYYPDLIGVFGSYARNENTKKSDIDLLVSFKSNITLFDLIGIEQELSEKLGIKIDLVTQRSLNDKMKPYVYQDLKYIYKC